LPASEHHTHSEHYKDDEVKIVIGFQQQAEIRSQAKQIFRRRGKK